MATKECPSCGNILETGQAFCPMCGTKVEWQENSKGVFNREFESRLFNVENYAELALGAGLNEKVNGVNCIKMLNNIENEFLDIIKCFPEITRGYLAYVDYMIKFVDKLLADKYANCDTELIFSRCRKYLETAKRYATDAELEEVLEKDSLLTAKIESLTASGVNDIMKERNQKQKKAAKWGLIVAVVCVFVWFICWILNS